MDTEAPGETTNTPPSTPLFDSTDIQNEQTRLHAQHAMYTRCRRVALALSVLMVSAMSGTGIATTAWSGLDTVPLLVASLACACGVVVMHVWSPYRAAGQHQANAEHTQTRLRTMRCAMDRARDMNRCALG